MFRSINFYWMPVEIWTVEYLVYNIGMVLLFIFLFKGKVLRHMGNVLSGYLLYQVIGTITLIGILYIIHGFDLEKSAYVMNWASPEYFELFLLSNVICIYLARCICNVFFEIRVKWVEWFKLLLACVSVVEGFNTKFENALISLIAFIILVLICCVDQERKYKKVVGEFKQLNRINAEQNKKIEEMSRIRHDIDVLR